MDKYIDIVFDGPPSHESGRFVEVENQDGHSISIGEWIEREDGFWALRTPVDIQVPEMLGIEIGMAIHTALRKTVDSRASSVVWNGIHLLPEGEWATITESAAKHIVALFREENNTPTHLSDDVYFEDVKTESSQTHNKAQPSI